jgi:lipopolysaccharide exporter
MEESTLKSKTAKGLFWSGLSNGLQQLLNLFFGIFLARLLNVEDYGMVGMLTVFSVVANSIQESGFTAALTNRKNATHEDFNAVFWFSFGLGAFLYVVLFFCAPFIASYYHTPALVPLARFVFLGFFISSTGTAHNAILFKNLKVKEKTKATLLALVVSGTTGVCMAYNGMAYWGIATQNVTYIAVCTAMLWYYSKWRPTFTFSFQPIREMLPFSIKLLITNIFRYINENLFPLILGHFYTKVEVGFFTQGNKWTNMGQSTITGIINGVSQPVMVEVNDEKERQKKVFRKMMRFTAYTSFPCMFGLAIVAPEFITITITAKWLGSVPIMQLLCLWGAFIPISYLYINLLLSNNKSNIYMWNVISQCGVMVVALLLTLHEGVLFMVSTYVTINLLWLLIWHHYAQEQIQVRLIETLKDIVPYLGVALLSISIGYLTSVNIDNIYLRLCSKIILTAGVYMFILWKTKSVLFRESVEFIMKKKHARSDSTDVLP